MYYFYTIYITCIQRTTLVKNHISTSLKTHLITCFGCWWYASNSNDRAAANIDKAELKVQERLVVCACLDEIVDKTKTKTKTETQRAGELVARTRLVKAKQTLVKLQAIQERPRKRQKTLRLTETEKWAAVPGDA